MEICSLYGTLVLLEPARRECAPLNCLNDARFARSSVASNPQASELRLENLDSDLVGAAPGGSKTLSIMTASPGGDDHRYRQELDRSLRVQPVSQQVATSSYFLDVTGTQARR